MRMTSVDLTSVLTLYDWAARTPLAATLVIGAAKYLIFAVPLAVVRRWREGLPLLVVTLVVGAARVAAAVHWPSDIVGTTLLALVLGWCACVLTGVVLPHLPLAIRARCGLAAAPPLPSA